MKDSTNPVETIPDLVQPPDSAMDAASPVRVFVYGTLKPGGRYHEPYCGGRVRSYCEAIAYGDLYDLPVGYPAMTKGDRPIQGVVLTLTHPDDLRHIDQLEGHDPDRPSDENEYERSHVEVFDLQGQSLGTVWMYWMPLERVHRLGGTYYAGNCWVEHS
jgi:gamma-glutamylcyclotransferase (GGCT)/AIG2-like uncharacterized protein YtfP